jgi:hypothetical protein
MVLATVENTVEALVPSRLTEPIITTAIKAAIKPYSKAVTPRSSLASRFTNRTTEPSLVFASDTTAMSSLAGALVLVETSLSAG